MSWASRCARLDPNRLPQWEAAESKQSNQVMGWQLLCKSKNFSDLIINYVNSLSSIENVCLYDFLCFIDISCGLSQWSFKCFIRHAESNRAKISFSRIVDQKLTRYTRTHWLKKVCASSLLVFVKLIAAGIPIEMTCRRSTKDSTAQRTFDSRKGLSKAIIFWKLKHAWIPIDNFLR
jgi:hypothetical protein